MRAAWVGLVLLAGCGSSTAGALLEHDPSPSSGPGAAADPEAPPPVENVEAAAPNDATTIVDAGAEAEPNEEDAADPPPPPPPPPPPSPPDSGASMAPCVDYVTVPSRTTYVGKVTYEATDAGAVTTLFFNCQSLNVAAACEQAIKNGGLVNPTTCHVNVPAECQVCTNAGTRW